MNQLTEPSFYGFDKLYDEIELINMDEIYHKVISSKFRKTKINEETEMDIKRKIEQCIQNKKPLQFTVPFGVYKAWRLNLDFQPDWAEVFNIS